MINGILINNVLEVKFNIMFFGMFLNLIVLINNFIINRIVVFLILILNVIYLNGIELLIISVKEISMKFVIIM